jgi:hypothetical protein
MVDSGGVDLGTFGQIQGTLPGLSMITKTLSRGPEWQELGRQYQATAGKDYDDSPTQWLAGSDQGSPVRGPGGMTGVSGALGDIAGAAEGLA